MVYSRSTEVLTAVFGAGVAPGYRALFQLRNADREDNLVGGSHPVAGPEIRSARPVPVEAHLEDVDRLSALGVEVLFPTYRIELPSPGDSASASGTSVASNASLSMSPAHEPHAMARSCTASNAGPPKVARVQFRFESEREMASDAFDYGKQRAVLWWAIQDSNLEPMD